MKPRIFIGSSVEGNNAANALQMAFHHDARATVWHQSFRLAGTTIDSLLEQFRQTDFAVFIFSADDLARMREVDHLVARDNVVFEAGLFMGMHGRDRVFIITPMGADRIHIPTDLAGYTVGTYDPAWAKTEPNAALGAAAEGVRQAIKASSWSKQNVSVNSRASYQENAWWPLKMLMTIRNDTGSKVRVLSRSFVFDKKFAPATNDSPLHTAEHKPAFRVGFDEQKQKDVYGEVTWIMPGETREAWVAFDPNKLGNPQNTLKELQAAASAHKVGVWSYRCLWDDERPVTRDYEINL